MILLFVHACVRAKTLAAKVIQGYDRAIIARFPGGVAVVVDRREGIAAKQKQRR
jgi:hypothetical protein